MFEILQLIWKYFSHMMAFTIALSFMFTIWVGMWVIYSRFQK